MKKLKMLEQFDQHEILMYIEGELPPARVERVRAQLAGHPTAARLVEQMRADRAGLQGLGVPELQDDLVTPLEPLLARPMLMGDAPGRFREQQRRQDRTEHARWPRLAVAAGITLLLGAGGIAAWSGLLDPLFDSSESPGFATDVDGGPGEIDSVPGLVQRDGSPPADQTAAGTGAMARSGQGTDSPGAEHQPLDELRRLASGHVILEPGFVLQLSSPDDSAAMAWVAEVMMSDVDSDSGATIALVRNFTYDEVADSLDQLVAAADIPEDKETVLTSLERRGGNFSWQQKREINRVLRRSRAEITLGEHLAGNRALAALPEDQLRFVELGATFAATIPAREFIPFLEQLWAGDEAGVRLLSASDLGRDGGAPAASTWERWQRWNRAIATFKVVIAGDMDNAMVVLPIAYRYVRE